MIDKHRRLFGPSRRMFSLISLSLLVNCSDDDPKVTAPTEPPNWRLIQQELPSALLSVQVISNGHVYAVGSDAIDGRGPYALRFDGEEWTRLPTGAEGDLWWVHEIGQDRILMSGANRLVLSFQPSSGAFSRMDALEGDDILYGIWGPTEDDIWAVGGDGRCGVALHFDGEAWSEPVLPQVDDFECVPTLFKVWGTGGDDVHMVGALGTTVHYDGSSLTFERTDTGVLS